MLAISRALMAAPQTDAARRAEPRPLAALTREIFEIVVRINRERGTTILLVEQNAQHGAQRRRLRLRARERPHRDGGHAARALREKDDIKEFYLGMKEAGVRGERRWKKKKTWR